MSTVTDGVVPYRNKLVVNLIYNEVQSPLEIYPDDTIYQVKQKIERLEIIASISPKKQELYLGGDKLKDELKVSDYNIRQNDRISLRRILDDNHVIQVFINTFENKPISILIDPNSTVLELKRKYHEKTLFSIGEQKLLWRRYQLEDERSLSSYEIPHLATINLVLRLH